MITIAKSSFEIFCEISKAIFKTDTGLRKCPSKIITSQQKFEKEKMSKFVVRVVYMDNTAPNSAMPSAGLVTTKSRICTEVVSSIPAWSTIIYRFLCGFICVSLCQSIKIKPTNMYIASARAQFKINTHTGVEIDTMCIPDRLSVVQCSHGHVIGVAFFGAISVAWSVRAGQLAAGGVASVWRSWVRSPPGPR